MTLSQARRFILKNSNRGDIILRKAPPTDMHKWEEAHAVVKDHKRTSGMDDEAPPKTVEPYKPRTNISCQQDQVSLDTPSTSPESAPPVLKIRIDKLEPLLSIDINELSQQPTMDSSQE